MGNSCSSVRDKFVSLETPLVINFIPDPIITAFVNAFIQKLFTTFRLQKCLVWEESVKLNKELKTNKRSPIDRSIVRSKTCNS